MRLKVEVFSPFLGILLSSVSLQKSKHKTNIPSKYNEECFRLIRLLACLPWLLCLE